MRGDGERWEGMERDGRDREGRRKMRGDGEGGKEREGLLEQTEKLTSYLSDGRGEFSLFIPGKDDLYDLLDLLVLY